MKTLAMVMGLLFSLGIAAAQQNQPITTQQIDRLINRALTEFSIPGAAIGIIKDGQVVLSKGYGKQAFNQPGRVNSQTLFKIGSNTKAFTAAALAILVDRGVVSWNTKVNSVLADFALSDQWITKEFTIVDLLTHRSGLAPFAGDLMLWPEPAGFTRTEIINNLKHLKITRSFRSEFAYDNLLYIVAGEVVAKLSGLSWEQFVEQEIFSQLKMADCYAGAVPKNKMNNLAHPHGLIDNQLTIIKRNQTYHKYSVMAAAGGIKCSVDDLLVWLQTSLNQGAIQRGNANKDSLYSQQQAQMMWRPHSILPVSSPEQQAFNPTFRSYGLGWYLSTKHGQLQVDHTGTLSGNLSSMVMLPKLKLGVVLMLNQNAYQARRLIMDTIIESYVTNTTPDVDNIKFTRSINKQSVGKPAQHNHRVIKTTREKLLDYQGIYQDPWFGQVTISLQDQHLQFSSLKSRRLIGQMHALTNNRFLVKFYDRTLEADAIVRFTMDANKRVSGFSIDRAHQGIDRSYDYVDLAFKRLK